MSLSSPLAERPTIMTILTAFASVVTTPLAWAWAKLRPVLAWLIVFYGPTKEVAALAILSDRFPANAIDKKNRAMWIQFGLILVVVFLSVTIYAMVGPFFASQGGIVAFLGPLFSFIVPAIVGYFLVIIVPRATLKK